MLKKGDELIFIAKVDYGVKKAAAKARLEHKNAGKPIFIMQKGQVVEISSENIEINDPDITNI